MPSCAKCHRKITDPQSIARGYGPVCWATVGIDSPAKRRSRHEGNAAAIPVGQSVFFCRRLDGEVVTNIPHRIVKHSPTGFAWGYGGSGPADLALNILACVIGQERAQRNGLYQGFKQDFIAGAPEEGAEISMEVIQMWISEHEGRSLAYAAQG